MKKIEIHKSDVLGLWVVNCPNHGPIGSFQFHPNALACANRHAKYRRFRERFPNLKFYRDW